MHDSVAVQIENSICEVSYSLLSQCLNHLCLFFYELPPEVYQCASLDMLRDEVKVLAIFYCLGEFYDVPAFQKSCLSEPCNFLESLIVVPVKL